MLIVDEHHSVRQQSSPKTQEFLLEGFVNILSKIQTEARATNLNQRLFRGKTWLPSDFVINSGNVGCFRNVSCPDYSLTLSIQESEWDLQRFEKIRTRGSEEEEKKKEEKEEKEEEEEEEGAPSFCDGAICPICPLDVLYPAPALIILIWNTSILDFFSS